MAVIKNFGMALLVFLVVILFSCLFTVHEGERALLLRLGKLTTDSDGKVQVFQPGLHFKYPFINTARHFDVRLQTMSANQYEVFTEGQKRLLVDYYVKWRIHDLATYYQRVGGYSSNAEALLEKRLNNALRSSVGQIQLLDFIAGQRVNVMKALREAADSTAADLGIEVIDVRIKQADLTPQVTQSVYLRMNSDRKQEAATFRARGQAKALEVRSEAQKKVKIDLANAAKDAAVIRAEGAQRSAEIYGNTYKQDAEFYGFYRSLQAYQHTFRSQSDLLVLQPDGDFFRYFQQATSANDEKKHKTTAHAST